MDLPGHGAPRLFYGTLDGPNMPRAKEPGERHRNVNVDIRNVHDYKKFSTVLWSHRWGTGQLSATSPFHLVYRLRLSPGSLQARPGSWHRKPARRCETLQRHSATHPPKSAVPCAWPVRAWWYFLFRTQPTTSARTSPFHSNARSAMSACQWSWPTPRRMRRSKTGYSRRRRRFDRTGLPFSVPSTRRSFAVHVERFKNVVFVNRRPPAHVEAPYVGIDNEAAGFAVGRYFASRDYGRCAAIHGSLQYSASRGRLEGLSSWSGGSRLARSTTS